LTTDAIKKGMLNGKLSLYQRQRKGGGLNSGNLLHYRGILHQCLRISFAKINRQKI